MKVIFFAMFCFVAGASLGAYQYIISTDAELAVSPSETAYSSSISISAKASAAAANPDGIETRYRTFSESDAWGGVFYRKYPGMMLIIH